MTRNLFIVSTVYVLIHFSTPFCTAGCVLDPVP